MNAFFIIGGLLAVWALILSALGVTRHGFPGGRAGGILVMGISVTLALGAIGSAVVTAALEEREEAAAEEGAAGAEEAAKGGGRQLRVEADPGGALAFDPATLSGEAGEVTLSMSNPVTIEHNVAIEGKGVSEEGKTVGEGGVSTVTAELTPGEYGYYCSVPGHREGGMEGTLTVE
jgi:plastocyanin